MVPTALKKRAKEGWGGGEKQRKEKSGCLFLHHNREASFGFEEILLSCGCAPINELIYMPCSVVLRKCRFHIYFILLEFHSSLT